MTDVLYAARAGTGHVSDLYLVNSTTAAVTSIGATGYAVTGLAFDPTNGILYGASSPNSTLDPKSLITIDVSTGVGTTVGSFGNTVSDIAFDSTGQLYGFNNFFQRFCKIDKSDGSVVTIGSAFGLSFGNGFSINASNVIYWIPSTTGAHLWSVDTSSGAYTDTGTMNDFALSTPSNECQAGAFDSGGTFWGVYDNSGLGKLNVSTRVWTDVGLLGGANTWDALAWGPPAGGGGGGSPDTPDVPEGICIAFTDTAFEFNPVWTRIDDPEAINVVAQWSTDRGRSSELDKSKTGTAVIEIIDTNGVLDPTNSFSPILDLGAGASIDPMRQVSIAIKNPLTNVWSSVFRGYFDELELTLDEAKNVFRGTINCVDAFAILSRNEVTPDNGLASGSGGTGTRVLPPTDSAGDVFYEDGGVDDRIRAALADASWASGMTVVFSGNVNVQETVYAVRSQILQIIQDAADAEFPGVANVYVDNFGRVVFHGRLARFDPATVAAGASLGAWNFRTWKAGDFLSWSVDNTYAPIKTLTLTRGMNQLINAALATPQGIIDADIQGQLSVDAGSIATYGVSSASWENLLTKGGKTDGKNAKDETKLFSNYFELNMADPITRISTLVFMNVQPGHPAEDAAWAFLCGVEIADTIDVLTHHPGGGGFNATFFVEGVRYTVTPLRKGDYHLITLEVDISPQSLFTTDPFS